MVHSFEKMFMYLKTSKKQPINQKLHLILYLVFLFFFSTFLFAFQKSYLPKICSIDNVIFMVHTYFLRKTI